MVAGVFGEAVLFDPSVFKARFREVAGEDVVHALAGVLGGEGAGGLGVVGAKGVEGVEIPGGKDFLHGGAREMAAILAPFFTGAGFALFDFDLLGGGIGVEVAEEKMRLALAAVGFENLQDSIELLFADGFILLQGVGMKMQNAEDDFFTRWSADDGFKEAIGFVVRSGMIGGVDDRKSA